MWMKVSWRAEKHIAMTLTQYEKEGFLRGEISATEQTKLVSFTSSLEECLAGAIYAQVQKLKNNWFLFSLDIGQI